MIKKTLKILLIALLWLGVWQISALIIGEELLFPSPISVASRLFEMALTSAFYKTIITSLIRILIGMLAGTVIGALGGLLTAFSHFAKAFFSPFLAVIKSTPVASFIILLVLWISRDATPVIIASMMVVPVVWTNVETGFCNTDRALLEMAQVYKMNVAPRIKHIYLPSVSPYFFASLRSSLGMSWKAGIAAEVLLQPLISIGKQIFESKQTLETVDLFAWTVVVIILSVVIEKLMVLALKALSKRYSFDKKGGETVG